MGREAQVLAGDLGLLARLAAPRLVRAARPMAPIGCRRAEIHEAGGTLGEAGRLAGGTAKVPKRLGLVLGTYCTKLGPAQSCLSLDAVGELEMEMVDSDQNEISPGSVVSPADLVWFASTFADLDDSEVIGRAWG
jgi:hypothetical protein